MLISVTAPAGKSIQLLFCPSPSVTNGERIPHVLSVGWNVDRSGKEAAIPSVWERIEQGSLWEEGYPRNVSGAPDGPDLCYRKLAEPPSERGGGLGKRWPQHTGHHSAVQMKSLSANKLPLPHRCQQNGGGER